MAARKLVSQKEFAATMRVTPQYVNKLVSQGKIRKVGNKIDARQAKAAIAAFHRPGRVVKSTAKRKGSAGKPSAARGPRIVVAGGKPESATASLTKFRAEREGYQAKLAELDYRKAMRELLPAAEVLEAERRKNANVRTSFRRLARSLAPMLHRASSPADLELTLLAAIDQVLDELARDPLGAQEQPPAMVQPEQEIPSPVEPAIAAPMPVDQAAAAAEASL